MVSDEHAIVSANTQRSYYRNGQLCEEVHLRKGRKHGPVRIWTRSGVLASEVLYEDGLLHGVCRQWDEMGRLLGQYTMDHGTGTQITWHENGQRLVEFSSIEGIPFGRSRLWLHDGTLIAEKIYLDGQSVSAAEYRAAAKADERLPKLKGRSGRPLPDGPQKEAKIHRVFVAGVLE